MASKLRPKILRDEYWRKSYRACCFCCIVLYDAPEKGRQSDPYIFADRGGGCLSARAGVSGSYEERKKRDTKGMINDKSSL